MADRVDNIKLDDFDIKGADDDKPMIDDEPSSKHKAVKDFYNHKKYDKHGNLRNLENGLGDDPLLEDLRASRRELSEKLESDAEFRARYVEAEKSRIHKKQIESETEDIISDMKKLQNKEEPDGNYEELPEETPGKYGVYIHRVENLTINIKL